MTFFVSIVFCVPIIYSHWTFQFNFNSRNSSRSTMEECKCAMSMPNNIFMYEVPTHIRYTSNDYVHFILTIIRVCISIYEYVNVCIYEYVNVCSL